MRHVEAPEFLNRKETPHPDLSPSLSILAHHQFKRGFFAAATITAGLMLNPFAKGELLRDAGIAYAEEGDLDGARKILQLTQPATFVTGGYGFAVARSIINQLIDKNEIKQATDLVSNYQEDPGVDTKPWLLSIVASGAARNGLIKEAEAIAGLIPADSKFKVWRIGATEDIAVAKIDSGRGYEGLQDVLLGEESVNTHKSFERLCDSFCKALKDDKLTDTSGQDVELLGLVDKWNAEMMRRSIDNTFRLRVESGIINKARAYLRSVHIFSSADNLKSGVIIVPNEPLNDF